MEGLKNEIKTTLEYMKEYGAGLTENQLAERLISKHIRLKKEIIKEANKIGLGLTEEKVNQLLKSKISIATNTAERLSKKIEDIIFVGITGSVAAESPKKIEDIDVMVITKKDSLWLTRWKWWWWMRNNKIPRRRWKQKEKADELCFNLWLEEDSLTIPREKRNLKNGMDLILMKPIFDKGGVYGRFLKANNWAKKYVATGYDKRINDKRYRINDRGYKINEKRNWLHILLNLVAYWGQRIYMGPKITTETVSRKSAFFHPKD